MATTSDIRKGLCIRYNHDIYKIVEFLHVKPGKGPAFVRTKLKSITTGRMQLQGTWNMQYSWGDPRGLSRVQGGDKGRNHRRKAVSWVY